MKAVAAAFIGEHVAEKRILAVVVDVATASLVVVEETSLMKRVEEASVVVIVEAIAERAEETVSATEMMRIVVVVVIAKVAETAKKIAKVKFESATTERRSAPAATLLKRFISELVALSSFLLI